MKHLYIIGNGFDIHTGLHTRYSEFRFWLENQYPFIYENMQATYKMNGEWWNEFEVQLGKLDIKKYVRNFTQQNKPINEVIEEIEQRKKNAEKDNIQPSILFDSPCARRLRGLLDVLQYCFEKWVVSCQRDITNPQYIDIEKEDSFFINFNYTDVIEILYKIPEERVLHIHGRSSKHERLIYGHNQHFNGSSKNYDEQKVNFELGIYYKNPYVHIYKHKELKEVLRSVEYVHIYGFSFSSVDEDYIDWIYNNVASNSQWEISWFSDIDKSRISNFTSRHWNIKNRLNIIRLEELAKSPIL